jgi:hypothetical protein
MSTEHIESHFDGIGKAAKPYIREFQTVNAEISHLIFWAGSIVSILVTIKKAKPSETPKHNMYYQTQGH